MIVGLFSHKSNPGAWASAGSTVSKKRDIMLWSTMGLRGSGSTLYESVNFGLSNFDHSVFEIKRPATKAHLRLIPCKLLGARKEAPIL
jgi:hypothetical protein